MHGTPNYWGFKLVGLADNYRSADTNIIGIYSEQSGVSPSPTVSLTGASPALWFYNVSLDSSWNNALNWYEDSSKTVPHGAIPTDGVNVIHIGDESVPHIDIAVAPLSCDCLCSLNGGSITGGIWTGGINAGTGASLIDGTFNCDVHCYGTTITGGTYTVTMEFSTSGTTISNSDISGCHLTPASGITVTDGGGNTHISTNFDTSSGGFFIGFGIALPVADGTWTGTVANGDINDDGNWNPSLGNPSTSASYTATIPTGLASYPSSGTAYCVINLAGTATLTGGTYSGCIITNSGAAGITGGSYIDGTTITFNTNAAPLSNCILGNASMTTVTADGVAVTPTSNTNTNAIFLPINGGSFIAPAVWNGSVNGDLNTNGNWDYDINPVASLLIVGTIPTGLGQYPTTGTAICPLILEGEIEGGAYSGSLTLNGTAIINGGTFSKNVALNGGEIVNGIFQDVTMIHNGGNITGGTFQGRFTITVPSIAANFTGVKFLKFIDSPQCYSQLGINGSGILSFI